MSGRMFSKQGYIWTHLPPSQYIGWKPRRKFRSRFRMDGSAVCTWDTISRTDGWGYAQFFYGSIYPHLYFIFYLSYLLLFGPFVIRSLLYCILLLSSNISYV